jgi:glutathione synthase/RimK-type ligase-like ATP-grasp enzyme
VNANIIILTGYDHFFGQTRKPWVSINTKLLIEVLRSKGLTITEYSLHEIANSKVTIRNSIVFYTFSQRLNLRAYIKDTILSLQNYGNTVIPGYELLCCHENKGYQELLKNRLGLDNLQGLYCSSKREIKDYEIDYPVVLKTIEGSNGKGVFLISSEQELIKKIGQLEPKVSVFTRFDLLRRRYMRMPKVFPGDDTFNTSTDYENYKDYIIPESGFVMQQFIPGLECDYRVIILGEHYYVTKRLTRKGDFRASGAKRFTFDFEATGELLDYAKHVFEVLDTPSLSVDIGVKDKQFYLFEFQALHFGINAIIRGKGYYQPSADGWKFIEHKAVFEKELGSALLTYLHRKDLL